MEGGIAIELTGTERVRRALDARRRELGETTREACVAIAVNTLRGVRSRTRVASERRVRVKVDGRDPTLAVAYSKKKGRGIIVGSDGNPRPKVKRSVLWAEKPVSRNHALRAYNVTNTVNEEEGRKVEWIIVARSEADAAKRGREQAARRIRSRKGLARLALGYCMSDLAVQTGLGAAGTGGGLTGLARRNAAAVIDERGLSSGEVAVRISDRLRYASKALPGGKGAVDAALDAALNKTRGLIVSKLKKDGRVTDALAVKGLF